MLLRVNEVLEIDIPVLHTLAGIVANIHVHNRHFGKAIEVIQKFSLQGDRHGVRNVMSLALNYPYGETYAIEDPILSTQSSSQEVALPHTRLIANAFAYFKEQLSSVASDSPHAFLTEQAAGAVGASIALDDSEEAFSFFQERLKYLQDAKRVTEGASADGGESVEGITKEGFSDALNNALEYLIEMATLTQQKN